jgi:hypothetical protein
MRFGKRGVVLVVAVGALIVGGVSYATIPDGGGVIHACYDKVSGQVRIYDSQTGKPKGCGPGEVAITWNQRGPSGASGASGPSGPSGAEGASGPAGPASSQVVRDSTSHYCFDNGAGEGPCEPGDVIDGGVNCPAGTTLFGGGVEIHAFHGPINDVTPVVGEVPNFTLYFSNATNSPGTGAGNGWVAGAVILNHNDTDYYDVAVTAVCST